jgi:putative transposase
MVQDVARRAAIRVPSSCGSHLRASLAIAALNMALAARRPAPGSLIDHSDRGVQYACNDYTDILEAYDLRPGTEPDRLPLRQGQDGEVDGRRYRDMDEARSASGTFPEDVDNRRRLHSGPIDRLPGLKQTCRQ